MTLLHCENLRFAYDGRTVCHNINFTLQTGDYLCIVGENGSGKSTLMKGILQLKKPSGGTLRMATALKADQIGYLPQQTDRQKDCPAVVQEVVLSGCLNRLGPRPFYGKKEKALAAKKWSSSAYRICKSRASAICRAARNNGSCWLARCVQPNSSSFWTNRRQGLTLW